MKLRGLEPTVAELSASAGLLLVTPLSLAFPLERLAIRDLRLGELGTYAKFPFELGQRDLQMSLAQSGHDRLVRLGVVVHLEGWIFVVQAMQPRL